MKKKNHITLMAALALSTILMSACGSSQKTETTAAQTETAESTAAGTEAEISEAKSTEAVETTEESSKDSSEAAKPKTATYKSARGWSVRFQPEDFEVKEDGDNVEFLYTSGITLNNAVDIRYIANKQPEEVLSEITEDWGVDPEKINRVEGFFPGTEDKWGYWREYADNSLWRTAIAGEYNGGVLVFIRTQIPEDCEGTATTDALAEILNSITYENFEPQTMYDYVPGKYAIVMEEVPENLEASPEYYIQLNEDHTGVISMKDDLNVLWGSIELIRTEPDFEHYQYDIEGTTLMVNYDDNWITFEKEN